MATGLNATLATQAQNINSFEVRADYQLRVQTTTAGTNAFTNNNGVTPVSAATASNPSNVNPNQTSGASKNTSSGLKFPLDLSGTKYIVTFEFYKYQRDSIQAQALKNATLTGSVTLPMPASLVEKFGMTYQPSNLGAISGFVGTGAGPLVDAINAAGTNVAQQGQQLVDNARNTAEALVNDPRGAVLIASRNIPIIGDSVGNLLERYQGITLNPYTALQFQSPEMRTHSFSFRLSPSNIQESQRIKDIIKLFKSVMHPGLSSAQTIYTYPDICSVKFGDASEGKLYTVYDSFVTGFAVNYAPQGTPAFFGSGTNEIMPTEVAMEIGLAEIRPLTRETL